MQIVIDFIELPHSEEIYIICITISYTYYVYEIVHLDNV